MNSKKLLCSKNVSMYVRINKNVHVEHGSLRIKSIGDKQGRRKISRKLRNVVLAGHFKTNDSALNEIGESRGLLKSIKERRWKLIGHTTMSYITK